MIRLALALLLTAPAAAETLIVGNKAEDSISLIDLASAREVRRLPTASKPHEVAVSPDGARAAVVAYGGKTIDLIDVASGKQIRRIDLTPNAAPHGIVWLRDGRIVVTTEASDTLTIVDPASGRVTGAVPTGQKGSHMVVIAPDATRAYVSNLSSRSVSVIDLAKGVKLRDLVAGDEPEGLALTPDGRELWVASRGSDDVRVYDTASFAEVAKLGVGDLPIRLAISPDGRTAISSNFNGGDLSVIDVRARKVVRTIKVSGDKAVQQVTILFDATGTRLYVAETAVARIAEVDIASGRVLRRFVAGKGSDGLGIARVAVVR